MPGIDDVFERLATDPAFIARLEKDPRDALDGYDLTDDDLRLLEATVSAGAGDGGSVEQRTSKAGLLGLLTQFSGGSGAGDPLPKGDGGGGRADLDVAPAPDSGRSGSDLYGTGARQLDPATGTDAVTTAARPRMQSSGQVTEVQVRGWEEGPRKAIAGRATPASSALGEPTGGKPPGDAFGYNHTGSQQQVLPTAFEESGGRKSDQLLSAGPPPDVEDDSVPAVQHSSAPAVSGDVPTIGVDSGSPATMDFGAAPDGSGSAATETLQAPGTHWTESTPNGDESAAVQGSLGSDDADLPPAGLGVVDDSNPPPAGAGLALDDWEAPVEEATSGEAPAPGGMADGSGR